MSQTQKAQSFAEYQGELLIGITAEMPSSTSLVQREGSPILDIMGKGVIGQLLLTEEGTLDITFCPQFLTADLHRKFSGLVGKLRPRWDQVTIGTGSVGPHVSHANPTHCLCNLDQQERPNIQHVAYSVAVMVSFWSLVEQEIEVGHTIE